MTKHLNGAAAEPSGVPRQAPPNGESPSQTWSKSPAKSWGCDPPAVIYSAVIRGAANATNAIAGRYDNPKRAGARRALAVDRAHTLQCAFPQSRTPARPDALSRGACDPRS